VAGFARSSVHPGTGAVPSVGVCAWTRNDECECDRDDTRCEQCAEAQQTTSIAGA